MTENLALEHARLWGEGMVSRSGGHLAALWRVDVHVSKDAVGRVQGTPVGGIAVHVRTVPPSRIDTIVLVDDLGPGGSPAVRQSPWFAAAGCAICAQQQYEEEERGKS